MSVPALTMDAEPFAADDLAPVPDFRYVGLEPVEPASVGAAAVAFGIGASMTLAASGADGRHVLLAGAVSSVAAALALRGAASSRAKARPTARMAVVPWGVLVDRDETPRILRWAGVRRVEVFQETTWTPFARARTSRVVVETDHERFVGEARGAAPLECLVAHLDAYAREQASPLTLGLDVSEDCDGPAPLLDPAEPFFEPLLGAARAFLDSAAGAGRLGLAPAGYRRAGTRAASATAVQRLRGVLAGRRRPTADARAFAAVLAAELRASELCGELVALTQSPHPLVAAVTKQAARKLGVSRARTGSLDEVAPFIWDADRARLDAWLDG